MAFTPYPKSGYRVMSLVEDEPGELTLTQKRILWQSQRIYQQYHTTKFTYWRLDVTDRDIDFADVNALVTAGYFRRTFYQNCYGHTDYDITPAGLAYPYN